MNTRIRYGAASVLGIASLAFCQAAWSLGLGDARVESFLDQPLEVQIELLTQSGDNLDAVTAGLASAEDYELIGASRNDISVPLNFSIEGTPGASSIVVRSQLPMNNPVVRLIVEVNSASGRMLREYTLFLDPATFSQSAPAPKVNAPASSSTTTAPAASTPRETTSETTVQTARPGTFTGTGEYGPVQSGDTLWRIAKDWSQGSGVSINQAMVAIQRNNPQAFAKGNINLLQRGAILRMPDVSDVNSIPVAEAISEVREQTAAFQMRQDVTSAATPLLVDENTAPQAIQPAPTPAPEPQPAIEPEEESTPEPVLESVAEESAIDESGDPENDSAGDSSAGENLPLDFEPQLELVPPSEEADVEGAAGFEESETTVDASGATRDLREELARKEEELINQQQQNAYLEQRLKELETQVAESEAGAVTDKNLASMEERLQQERLAEAQAAQKPWYSGLTLFWIGLLVIVAALAGWFMSRRGSAVEYDLAESPLRELQGEAEDLLRVLDSDSAAKSEPETVKQPVADTEPVNEFEDDESDETVIAPATEKEERGYDDSDDEAELLDEESADPEIQLDLARAYISMGDKEAARVILEEVVAHGTDAQKAEATKMKNLLQIQGHVFCVMPWDWNTTAVLF